jgi:multiple sugar transport system ATP-binding protein
MRVELAKLKAELGATIVYVTHDQIEAMTLADRIVVMSDGRVEQAGAPLDLYRAPANLFVAGFIGSPKMNFVPAQAVSMQDGAAVVRLLEGGTLALPVTQPIAPGAELTLGVRPEHLAPVDTAAALTVAVDQVEQLGGASQLHGRLPDGTTRITVAVPGQTPVRRGTAVGLALAVEDTHLFAEDGIALPRLGERR